MAYKHPGRIFDDASQDEESGSDIDSISLTSTVASEEDPNDTYIVENILGEKWVGSEGKMRYLVKWEGYPITRASWEPLEMFDDQDTIKEWKASQEAIKVRGGLPSFDWRRWDRERLAETEAQEGRKRRRAKKRQKLKRQRRAASSKSRQPKPTDTYTPDNDEVSDEITDSDEPLVSRKGRKPVVREGDDEQDSSSNDSLIFGSKNQNRQLARPKRVRESGGKSDLESASQKKPKRRAGNMTGGTASQEPSAARNVRPPVGPAPQNPRLGAPNLEQTPNESPLLKPGPTKLGPSKRLGTSKFEASKPAPTKSQPFKSVFQIPEPPARRKMSASGAGKGVPMNFSAVNRLRKKSQEEREPDRNALELYEASNPVPLSKKQSLKTGTLSSKDLNFHKINRHNTDDRRQLPPPRGPSGMSRKEKNHGQFHDRDLIMTPAPAPEDRFISAPKADIKLGIENSSLRRDSNKGGFVCEMMIQQGTEIQSVGHVEFMGFTTTFLKYLERLGIRELCVTKLLPDSLVTSTITNVNGYPQESADITFDNADKAQPLIATLAKYHALGIITNPAFTIGVYQPSSDKITASFRARVQRQKTPLRAVAYSDWLVAKASDELVSAEQHEIAGQMTNYLHTLGEKVLSISFESLIGRTEANPEGVRSFVVYCPDERFFEKLEMVSGLESLGLKELNSEELLTHLNRGKKIIILVHYTIQFCLHHLPNLKLLQAREHLFFFFGTRIMNDGGTVVLDSRLIRFWSFGTLILATPNLAINNPSMLKRLLDYQAAKAGSTTICIVSTMVAEVEKQITSNPGDYENSQAILEAVYQMQDSAGDELQVSSREGVSELEVIADAFAHHQAINCALYRRFIVAHAKDEAPPGLGKRYGCLELHNPESLFEVVMKGVVPPIRARSSASEAISKKV